MPFQPDAYIEMNRLIAAAGEQSILLRALGGLAVKAHHTAEHPIFTRDFGDLDLIVEAKRRREFQEFMEQAGYSPHK